MMLMYLYAHTNPNQEDIAKFFMLDKGSVAKTLQKLEKKRMIERSVNHSDQREKVITLTDRAYAVKDVCTNLLKLWNDALYQDLTPEEVAAFERIAAKISANAAADLEKWESKRER
jgi:MarR family transcriptional regulator, transcriptional regulator for hemolysin